MYATSFASLYVAMYLALIPLWLRPLALEYRAKIDNDQWRKVCDLAISFSGCFPPILFGVAFGNLMQGLPFSLNSLLMVEYHGSFVDLLNPFALLCGFVGLLMVLLQGSAWLMMKTTGALYNKARLVAQLSAVFVASLMVIGGLVISQMNGYLIVSELNHSAVSNPLNKQAIAETSAWLTNFETYSWMGFAPIGSVLIPVLALVSARLKWDALSFISSSLTNACVVLTAGFAMFPFILPSSVNPSHSLTLWDSTSSELTLNIMTGVAFVMVPIILCYTAFSYRTMFGRLDSKYVERNGHSLY